MFELSCVLFEGFYIFFNCRYYINMGSSEVCYWQKKVLKVWV